MDNLKIEPLTTPNNCGYLLSDLVPRVRAALLGDQYDPMLASVTIPAILTDLANLRKMVVEFKEIGEGIFPDADQMWSDHISNLDKMMATLLATQDHISNYYLATAAK